MVISLNDNIKIFRVKNMMEITMALLKFFRGRNPISTRTLKSSYV